MGLSPLLTGLLPVAIGTALPEAAGAVAAARRGQGDLGAGHVIGSSLVNILLVLGGMALIGHGLEIPRSFVRYELPAAFVFGAMLLPVLRGDMRVTRGEGIVLGIALLAWIAFEGLLLHG
jgi:cation:H+ antiporter